MTWSEVGVRNLDGSSITQDCFNKSRRRNSRINRTTDMKESEEQNSSYVFASGRTGMIINETIRYRKSTKEKRGRGGKDNDNNDIIGSPPPTFANEYGKQGEEFCIRSGSNNLTSSGDESCCSRRSRCTSESGKNASTFYETCNGSDDNFTDASSVFRSCSIRRRSRPVRVTSLTYSGCDVFSGDSKGYNQLFSLPSSSTLPSWLLFLLVFSWNLSSTSSFCPSPHCSCDDIALSVDCHSASNLRVVPIFLNPQIKFLSLSKNQIKDITMSLQFYSELHVLDFSHNKIESLGKTNFESLKNLHLLNVSYNSLKTMENGVFTGLTHVTVVDLRGNLIERIEREVFRSLPKVREIILDRNRLSFLDWELFRGLDTLQRISAKFNFIQVIEPSVSVSSGAGGVLAGGLISNPNLEDISQSNSSGSGNDRMAFEVGKGIPGWTSNLRYLDISSNQLTRVKDYGLVIFGALKELNLCCNYIHTLEEKAFLISATSSSGGRLERLNLRQNRLGRVPTEALEKLGPTLREIDLTANRISDHISKNAFRGLVHVESLRISDNPEILYIDPDALSENINLINFEADYLSNVTEISASLFKNKMFLENFSLKYASISSLSPEFFQPPVAQVAGSLDLTGNPIDCNCSAHSFFQFVTEMGASTSAGYLHPEFDQIEGADGVRAFRDENNNLIQENAFRSTSANDEGVPIEKSNLSSQTHSTSELSSQSNPNLISHQPRSQSPYHSSNRNNLSGNNKSKSNHHISSRTNLLYVRCQSPGTLAGVLVKDLKPSDFEHCFSPDDQFQIMVICIAALIASLIFLTLLVKLCCVCGLFRWLSTFCKTHCSTTNCCQLKSRKEKQSSDKLFFDSMTIALRRDLAPVAPPPNFNANLPNGKSILGDHPASHLLYNGNSTSIPLTTSGCIIGGGNSGAGSGAGIGTGTLGRNGNGNHPITMSMDYDDCYQDEDEDDDDDDEPEQQHPQQQHRSQHQHYGHHHRGEPLERCYAPIEPPPPIPALGPLQFSNQVQSLSRKQQQKHQQLLLHHGHQHHSPTMGYSPKHYSHHHHHPHSSPKHSQLQQQPQQNNPPVIVHYEYPDFPSMHRVKQVPSVLV